MKQSIDSYGKINFTATKSINTYARRLKIVVNAITPRIVTADSPTSGIYLNRRVCALINRNPNSFKTITADNGTEFNQYKAIEDKQDIEFYFANPYHSWERGSNENLNGLIRQYLPRGSSMASLTQRDCDKIANQLNLRPRKRHHHKTPEVIFYGF